MKMPSIADCEVLEFVGSGSAALVHRCRLGGREAALKIYDPLAVSRRHLGSVLERLGELPESSGVVPVLAADLQATPPWCIQAWVGPVEVSARRTLQEVDAAQVGRDQAWRWVMELAQALAHWHLRGLAHSNLRPRHVLIERLPGGGSRLRLCDGGEGLVDGVQRLEPTDHGLFLCPQQVRHPNLTATRLGLSFDVFAFGTVAYRLLTGRAPRAEDFWQQEQERLQRRPETKVNTKALMEAVEAQPSLDWPTPAADASEERRREVIGKALELDEARRWVDMREVFAAFESLQRGELQEQRAELAQRRAQQSWRLQLGFLAVAMLALAWALNGSRHNDALHRQLAGIEQGHAAVLQQEQRVQQELRAQLQKWENDFRQQAEALQSSLQRQALAGDLASSLLEDWLAQQDQSNPGDVAWKAKAMAAVVFCQRWLEASKGADQIHQRLQLRVCQGRLLWSLHQEQAALQALEQAQAEAEAAMASLAPADRAPLQLGLGRAALVLAQIDRQHGRDAGPHLRQAADALGAALERQVGNLALRREAAVVCMELGEVSLEQGRWADAQRDFGRLEMFLSADALGDQPEADDLFLLARAAFASGWIDTQDGRVESGMREATEALAVMADLVMNRSPRQQPQALVLAQAYLDLGEVMVTAAAAQQAREAHEQAQMLLLELNRLQPEWDEVKYQLARARANLSLMDRDEGLPGDAVRRKQDAIEMLNEILAADEGNIRFALLLARCRSEYAELMMDLGRRKEAVPIAEGAVAAMRDLLKADRQSANPWRRQQWEMQWAGMLSVLGQAQAGLGRSADAGKSYTEALMLWEALDQQKPGQESVQQGLALCRERLAKLR
jgi:hypothetical protein